MPQKNDDNLIDLSSVSIENDFHIALDSVEVPDVPITVSSDQPNDEPASSPSEEAAELLSANPTEPSNAEPPSQPNDDPTEPSSVEPASSQSDKVVEPPSYEAAKLPKEKAPESPRVNAAVQPRGNAAAPTKDKPTDPKKQRKMPLGVKILIGVVIGAIALALIIVAAFNIYMRATYSDFYSNAEAEFDIPGLSEGFVPQDMDYVPAYGAWLFSGYMGDDSASPIYRRADDGTASRVYITRPDGTGYEGHGGGIASDSEHILITDGSGYLVMGLEDVMNAEEGEFVEATGYVPIEFTPAFLDIFGGMLYAGNFYDGDNYDSPEKMHVNVAGGGQNCAIMYAFEEDDSSPSGWSQLPVEAYSIPDKVQGVCAAANGDFVFSTSWGFNPSHLYVYKHPYSDIGDYEYSKLPLMPDGEESGNQGFTSHDEVVEADAMDEEEPDSDFVSIPLYVFTPSDLRKDIEAIPMTEGIQLDGSRIFICNESASDKYFFGKLMGAQACYSIDIVDFPTVLLDGEAS